MFKKKLPPFIVDIHCHILPSVDDGSRNMSETIAMLKIAKKSGITHIFATPHYKTGHRNVSPKGIERLTMRVLDEAEKQGINIDIASGNEVLFFSEFDDYFEHGCFCGMNDQDFVLVEFLPEDRFEYIKNALDLIQGLGITPILAHIERYSCFIENFENARIIHNMGVQIQVNAADVTGFMGRRVKKFIHRMLKAQLVDYIGSDAHRCKGKRTPCIKKCVKRLYRKYPEKYVDRILYKNAFKYLL